MTELNLIEHLRATSHLIVGSNFAKHLDEERFSRNAELILVKQSIDEMKQYVKEYIHGKDKLWTLLREQAKSEQKEQ